MVWMVRQAENRRGCNGGLIITIVPGRCRGAGRQGSVSGVVFTSGWQTAGLKMVFVFLKDCKNKQRRIRNRPPVVHGA